MNESLQLPASSLQLNQHFPKATSAIAGKSETLIEYVKDRPGHDRRYAIDASKAEIELGFRPTETFETGIRKTIEWYLNNEHWWQSLIQQ